MRVTVIIPAYNCEDFVSGTVESVLNAGLNDYEIIIVDDGSKDNTPDICDKLETTYTEVRCIHQENQGVSAARNRGIEAANGEYILFFDADDSVESGSMVKLNGIMNEYSPDMIIFGITFDYYHKGRIYRSDEMCFERECILDIPQWCAEFEKLYDCNALTPVWNKLFKKQLLVENNVNFDSRVFEMEDFLYSISAMKFCESIYVLNEPIYRYRQPEDEMSTFNRLKRVKSLSEYMIPFEEEMEKLEAAVREKGYGLESGSLVINKIYAMMYHCQIQFADEEYIIRASKDLLGSKYKEMMINLEPALMERLEHGEFSYIYKERRKERLRHKIAVRVKSIRSYGR